MAAARWVWRAAIVGVLACLWPSVGSAATSCGVTTGNAEMGRLVSVEGRVDVRPAGEESWRRATIEDALCVGDRVRVGQRSRAAVSLLDNGVLRIDADTTLTMVSAEPPRSLLDVVRGAVQFFSREPATLQVGTPYLNAGVEGTEFLVRVGADDALVAVYDGVVVASNELGEVRLDGGEAAVARAGHAPTATVLVRPREAVQWSLYYPPILAGLADRSGRPAAGLPERLTRAVRLGAEGKVAEAFEALDAVPEAEREARFYLYRAALSLSVGGVDDARRDIERSLRQDPENALAYALRSVIAVARNQPDQALADGRRAIELDPDATAARIALSYALQSAFELEPARDVLLQAVEDDPDDPLAWARLAELQLALGDQGRAERSAATAVGLSPAVAATQTVLGFVALARLDTGAAKAAFRRAIELDPASPMPRLGLGLAQIRESDLDEGRNQIEIAVALDPESALLRTYLGRAYFEENREQLASEMFAIAKDLDPRDPTAYFFDGLLKETENRPVEALEGVQRAIDLNNNRLVYRGRLLLDQDFAARGAALARIYQDLGFDQFGASQATQALTVDPSSATAHRFLSDIYRDRSRRETARVSELLQAQLLQDLNINPVQPRFVDTNINIISRSGPVAAGINEFTPLFERNDVQLTVSGTVGSHDTYGGEAVASGLYENVALSAGHLHFQSNGFRQNFDMEEDVTDVLAQVALTPDLSVQAEYFRREADQGDIRLRFDPDVFSPDFDRTFDRQLGRIGGRYLLSPASTVLFSVMYGELEDRQTDGGGPPIVVPGFVLPGFPPFVAPIVVPPTIFTFGDILTTAKEDGFQGEAQYLYRRDRVNVVAGFDVARVDLQTARRSTTFRNGVLSAATSRTQSFDIDQENFYVYSNIRYPDELLITLGMSFSRYEEQGIELNELNPKVGVQWTPFDGVRFRAAATRSVKPPTAFNRTIQPTQVAGFNQFFDDPDGTLSFRYGAGVDVQVIDNLFVGAEMTWREFQVPVRRDTDVAFDERKEKLHLGYVYWAPLPRWAFRLQAEYDTFENTDGFSVFPPDEVRTFSLPIAVSYFHPSGLFVEVGATHVDQEVVRAGSGPTQGESDFTVVDAAVGFRLPNRLGIVSLEVRNLFDRRFKYLDDTFREFSDEPTLSPYLPERTILGRATLTF